MLPFLLEQYGNASSQYSHGVKSRRAIEYSRQQAAQAICAEPSEIIFTSGGSEGNNWILQGISTLYNEDPIHIITTAIEHYSVLNACRILEKRGVSVTYLPVDDNGRVSVIEVENVLRSDTKLVSIMFANNEIGTIQPISEIGAFLRNRGVLFHTDAVQAVGHLPIDIKELKVDFFTASAHKFYGAKGTGYIYIRSGLELPQLIFGGNQEHGKRAGTESVAGIVALGYALEESIANMPNEQERLLGLRRTTIDSLKIAIPNIKINADNMEYLPGILNVTFPDVSGEAMMNLLDLKGICISTSSACNSGKAEPSHVLLALGLSEQQAKNSIRISYGRYNTLHEVAEIVKAISDVYNKIKELKSKS
jgi:cysteine desulfurase